MSTTLGNLSYDQVERLSRRGSDLITFWRACAEVIDREVPHYGAPCWVAADPASLMITSYVKCGLPKVPQDWLAREFYQDDYNTFLGLARSAHTVSTLHDATDGVPTRSSRFRHTIEPSGADQEVRAILRTPSHEIWGGLALYRAPGDPAFSDRELEFLTAIAPLLANGTRTALLVGDATEPDVPDAPGLIVVGSDWSIESMTPGADQWLDELPDERRVGELPATILAVAGRALRSSEGTDPPGEPAFARVLSRAGRWLLIHGTTLCSDGVDRAAVIIEPAHPARIAPLLMQVYQLTEREQDVTRLVLQGQSTGEIAATLFVSTHTVQQHLKSIFDKTGVRSRRDLVSRIFFAHYEPRLRDNESRSADGRPHRGGPMDLRPAAV